jgi:hypothetical protein
MLPPGSVMTPPPFSCRFYHSGSPEEVEGHLPEQDINGILYQPREPGTKGIVVKMREPKILLNDIADF